MSDSSEDQIVREANIYEMLIAGKDRDYVKSLAARDYKKYNTSNITWIAITTVFTCLLILFYYAAFGFTTAFWVAVGVCISVAAIFVGYEIYYNNAKDQWDSIIYNIDVKHNGDTVAAYASYTRAANRRSSSNNSSDAFVAASFIH